MIFPQPLMIVLCLLIPAYFLYLRKEPQRAVCWIAWVTVLDIFNSQLYLNLPAVVLFGFVALPYVWIRRRSVFRGGGPGAFVAFLPLLVVLGIYYGLVNPWPDPTGSRSPKDLAPARALLHLGRTLLEFSTAFFLMTEIQSRARTTVSTYLRTVFFGSIVLCLSAIAEKYLRMDAYHFFTGGRELLLPDRLRGFSYEPRGLGQNLVYATILLPWTPLPRWKYLAAPVFLVIGFVGAFSFTGAMVLITGALSLCVYLLLKNRSLVRRNLVKIAAGVAASVAAFSLLLSMVPRSGKDYMAERLNVLRSPRIVEKLEVFDAAAINFLNHHPEHYLLGTGPGLVYLPATHYILPRDMVLWSGGFQALPHMGLVLILSNAGLLGLSLFLLGLWSGFRKKSPFSQTGMLGTMLMGIYMIQIRYFFLFGLACMLADDEHSGDTAL